MESRLLPLGSLCPQLLHKLMGLTLQFGFSRHLSIAVGVWGGEALSVPRALLAGHMVEQLQAFCSLNVPSNNSTICRCPGRRLWTGHSAGAIPHPSGARDTNQNHPQRCLWTLSRTYCKRCPRENLSPENIKLARVCRRLCRYTKIKILKSEATTKLFYSFTQMM